MRALSHTNAAPWYGRKLFKEAGAFSDKQAPLRMTVQESREVGAEPHVPQVRRGGVLTAILVLLFGLEPLAAVGALTIAFLRPNVDHPTWLWPLVALLGGVRFASVLGVWFWRKWGVALYVLASAAIVALAVRTFGPSALAGLAWPAVLLAAALPKWRSFIVAPRYPFLFARRYLASKKRDMISISTFLAINGVTTGVAALAVVMSVTGGFQEQFRDKVLGVNAHVLVLKYSIDFREYREVMKKVEHVKGVTGVAPFVISPMMVTNGDRTATGVLLKGVDPELMPKVLDLPKHILPGKGSLDGLRRPGAKPPERMTEPLIPTRREEPRGPTTQGLDGGAPREPLLPSLRREPLPTREPDPLDAGVADAADPNAVPAGAPVGDVTPDGGYPSHLPDSFELPDSIEPPDPCKTPELLVKLPGAAVGSTLAKQLAVGVGDCIQVTSPTIGVFGASNRPAIAKQFRVIAIFEAGFDQYDSKLVYTDIYEAQTFYEYGDSVTGVEMRVDDIDRARDIAKEIDGILANGVYHTMDWHELNHGLFTALLIQQIGMSVILALIIVVAAFQVIATLTMIALEKKKDLALLKAIGATDGAVLKIFLYQGLFFGLVGTVLGLLLGFFLCKVLLAYAFPLDPKVYFISSLPVSMKPGQFIITGVFSVLTCLLATLIPAVFASRHRPADGLRPE